MREVSPIRKRIHVYFLMITYKKEPAGSLGYKKLLKFKPQNRHPTTLYAPDHYPEVPVECLQQSPILHSRYKPFHKWPKSHAHYGR